MNTELLRKVQKHILEEPKRVHMSRFVFDQDEMDEYRLKPPACGTVACIGGWAAILGGKKESAGDSVSGALLDINFGEGERLFYRSAWPTKFSERLDRAKPQTEAYAQVVSDRIDHFIETGGQE